MTRNALSKLTPPHPAPPRRGGVSRSYRPRPDEGVIGYNQYPSGRGGLAGTGADPPTTDLAPRGGESTCAFERCQAGGTILPTAPRMSEVVFDPELPDGWFTVTEYHPGCWAAETAQGRAS